MVRQRLNSTFLACAVVAAVLGGCATTPPPASEGAPQRPGEPAEVPAPQPGAEPAPRPNAEAPTLALLRQSERSAHEGDLDAAIAYVERAIRLNGRDAALWLRLARLQLAADHPTTAEQLAHKAIALADDRSDQRREGWLLIADAREAQGDDEGAATIRARWRTYRG